MIPGSLAMMAGGIVDVYRYLRFGETANVGGAVSTVLRELHFSADGGATYVPSSAMTSNTAPSPLVATADSEYGPTWAAWHAFDNDAAPYWASEATAHPHWITIDLGAGNGITPNRVRFTTFNSGGDYTPKDFTIQGSNTGAFAGEQTTLLTVAGAGSQPDGTVMTYTI